MNNTTPDPIDNTERVLVRQTVTGFEQGIAAGVGFFTAGPLGAVAAWGSIRGVQGKWTPWVLLGAVAAPVINLVNLAAILAVLSVIPVEELPEADEVINRIPPTEQLTNI